MSRVPDKIDLPINVAFRIVLQGLRIRLGRSLITISGVLLGIMFLTSTMTSFLIKEGVKDEDQLRSEVSRMKNFLTADLGPIAGKTILVIAGEELNNAEIRLLNRIDGDKAGKIMWTGDMPTSIADRSISQVETPWDHLSECNLVLFMGSGTPNPSSLNQLQQSEYKGFVAGTRLERDALPEVKGIELVALSGQLNEEELAKQLEQHNISQRRLLWILVIALLVTIMGIANAMLMSVTERFREIGTMKCLGATSRLIRRIFLIESVLLGACGGLAGAVLGALFSFLFHAIIYGFTMVGGSLDFSLLTIILLASFLAGILLSILAAVYPANVASNMVPAHALRSNI